MTLLILDENGHEVTPDNPLITEHNGGTGDTLVLPLTLVNGSSQHYYRNITIQVNSVPPVNASLFIQDDPVPQDVPIKTIIRMYPAERFGFDLKLSVRPHTPEQVVTGVNLRVFGMKYPVPL